MFACASLAACGSDDVSGGDGGASKTSPRGTVSLLQYVTSSGGAGYGVAATAAFFADAADATSTCPVTSLSAACSYVDCPTPNAPTPGPVDGGTTPVGQAGTVTVSGLSFPGGALSLPGPATGTGYAGVNPLAASPFFRGGDAITFSAAGDSTSIGPFSVTLVAPADAVVTSPLLDGTTSLALSRTRDLTVTWQPGTPGTSTVISLYQLDPNGDGGSPRSVTCVFDATAGSGTLPAAGGFANFDVIDGTAQKGELIVLPYANKTASATSATGVTWPIYATVYAASAEAPITLP